MKPVNKKEKVIESMDKIVEEAHAKLHKQRELFLKTNMKVRRFLWFKYRAFKCGTCKKYFPIKKISLVQSPAEVKKENEEYFLREQIALICRKCLRSRGNEKIKNS